MTTTPEIDPSSHLVKKFVLQKAEITAALANPDFYIQTLIVGITLVLAGLVAVLIRRRVKIYYTNHPPKRIDIEFILKPFILLGPILALVFLSAMQPFADQYAADINLTDALTQLAAAYLLAKCVLLIIRSRPVAYFIALVIMVTAALRATGFVGSIEAYLSSVGFTIGQFHITMLNLVNGVVILVVVFWIAGVLSRTLESYLRRSSGLSYSARELSVKFFRVFIYFVAILITLSAVGVDLTAFAVFGGALGVGIGLGLQKITANFVSGITLLLEKSIQIGDLIEVASNTGWVRQLNIRYTLIETFDGRDIMIPNEELVSSRVTNWTHTNNLARIEVIATITYKSDAVKARQLMLDAAREHKECMREPEPNCWLREFGSYGMKLVLVFWIPNVKDGRNGPQSDVMFVILDKFRKAGVDMAEVAAVQA